MDAQALLHSRAREGYELLRKRACEDFMGATDTEYRDRLAYEFSVFEDVSHRNVSALGYGTWADFLLVTADYTNAVRPQGVFVGGGRGSAAGSLACLCLGITTGIDPLRFELIFERFLNPGRVSAPDIDLDFSDQGKVFEYLENRYGKNRVVRICAPQYLKPKSAIERAGTVVGMDIGMVRTVNRVYERVEKTGVLRDFKDVDPAILDAAFKASDDLREYQNRYPELLPLAKRFLGLLAGHSTHPAGALISARPAGAVLPLMRIGSGKDAGVRTAWDSKTLERQGWVKLDVLSVTNLRIIIDALELVRQRHGIELKPEDIPLRDREASRLLRDGNIVGIFQIGDNQVAHRLCKELPVETVDDVALVNALIRPGIEWDATVKNKQYPDEVYYPVGELRDILKDSYGVFTYQEQIMWACTRLAGFSMVEADTVRKIVATTSNESLKYDIEDWHARFVDGCAENGHGQQLADIVWRQIKSLATYCFNKAHAVSYGVIAWQEAYIKARWPAEYLCACLNDVLRKGSTWRDRFERFVIDAKRHGIEVIPPCVNRSQAECHVDADGRLVLGLSMVKNVGKSGKKAKKNAPYKDYRDFVARSGMASAAVRESVKRSRRGELFGDDGLIIGGEGCIDDVTQNMIYAGCFDELHNRRKILEELHPAVEITAALAASWEEGTVGFFVTTNPLLDLADEMKGWIQHDDDPRKRGFGGGLVTKVKTSAGGHGFIECKTLSGTLDLVCWADNWAAYQRDVKQGCIIRGSCFKTRRGNFAIDEIEFYEVDEGSVEPVEGVQRS